MEELLTLQEACKYLKINRMTLYKMVWGGRVPVYKVGRQWRFKKSALDNWLEESQKGYQHSQKSVEKRCVFLTGATGYLGSNLILKFIEHGYSLKLLVRPKRDDPRSRIMQCLSRIYNDQTQLHETMKKIEIIEGDVIKNNLALSEEAIQALSEKVSDVFHCAAAVSFDEEKEDIVRKNNIEGTRNILSFMLNLARAHLHYMSTAYVCGQHKGIVREDELAVRPGFNNSYESSKYESENLVRKWISQHNIKTTIYRPSIIVGDSKTGQTQSKFGLYGILRIVDVTIRNFKLRYKKDDAKLKVAGAKFDDGNFFIPLRVIGRRDKTLNLVNIDYVSEAIIRIFEDKNNTGKTYHITNPHPPKVGLLKDCLCAVLGAKGIRFVYPEDFKTEPMEPWERSFNKNIKMYTPYLLLEEPKFDDTNTRKALKNTGAKQPKLDKKIIMKLLAYSYSTNYGKNQ